MPTMIYLAVYLLVTPLAFARETGPGVGGGGGGILCLNPDQSVKSVDLVDLVESAFYDKTSPDMNLAGLPWQQQVSIAVNRVAFADPQFHFMLVERMQAMLQNIEDSLKETKDTDLIFPAPQDLSAGRLPPMRLGCQLVGAAIYNDSNVDIAKLTISHFIWKHFSEMNKAALILHEAIYLTHRDIFRNIDRKDFPNSSATRALVGYLLSNELSDSQSIAERLKFQAPGAYRSVKLSGRAERFIKPLLPYFLRNLDRPLFVDQKTCSKGNFHVVVVDKKTQENAKNRCRLQSTVRKWKSKFEISRIPLYSFNEESKTSVYRYNMSATNIFEDITLVCPSSGFDRFNPGFRLYCGREVLSSVPGSDSSSPLGFPIKFKHDVKTFLEDFHPAH